MYRPEISVVVFYHHPFIINKYIKRREALIRGLASSPLIWMTINFVLMLNCIPEAAISWYKNSPKIQFSESTIPREHNFPRRQFPETKLKTPRLKTKQFPEVAITLLSVRFKITVETEFIALYLTETFKEAHWILRILKDFNHII